MERRKHGLLPKWIYIVTIIKLSRIFFITIKLIRTVIEQQNQEKKLNPNYLINIIKSFNWFYVLHFILVFLRLINIRNICKTRVFSFITISFGIDCIVYLLTRIFFSVSILETVSEVVFSCVSMAWMIFLYPYYLNYDSDLNKKDKVE